MIEVEVNGSIYSGRFVNMRAQEESFATPEGFLYYENYGYQLEMMDANGVIMNMTIKDPKQITFVG